jgi:cell division protein FtsI (penicillin-binding protein 3)
MNSKASKILGLFVILALGFMIFLARVFDVTTSDRFQTNAIKKEIDSPLRGEIVSSDGFKAAISQKTYSVAVNPENIKPEQLNLFVRLFCIYSGMNEQDLRAMLHGDRRVVLLDSIDGRSARNFRQLSASLDKMKIFTPKRVGGKYFRYGLEVFENEFLRNYAYDDLFQPMLGYVKLEDMQGLTGIEHFYDKYLSPDRAGYMQGFKDVGGNLILNRKLDRTLRADGFNIKLNINFKLQKQLEQSLDKYRKVLDSEEIMAAVMESSTGRVLALASSNRYIPYGITKESVNFMKINPAQYVYEPGSTIKPIVFAMLLENGKLNQFETINAHNGRMNIGPKTITDEHSAAFMTAEDGIVFSSNIVMAQIAQRLDSGEYIEGLKKFGFGKRSGVDVSYELKGDLPTKSALSTEIYKATVSYGYGMRANFMQVMGAYNIFNNDGVYITPKIANSIFADGFEHKIVPEEVRQVISQSTTAKMKTILKKVIEKGTGVGAKVDGIELGGKTGTAHIAKNGVYVRNFNSSFFGFANDGNSKYTIGVLVVDPQKAHFAAMTAVPVFKDIVVKLIKDDLLKLPTPQNVLP